MSLCLSLSLLVLEEVRFSADVFSLASHHPARCLALTMNPLSLMRPWTAFGRYKDHHFLPLNATLLSYSASHQQLCCILASYSWKTGGCCVHSISICQNTHNELYLDGTVCPCDVAKALHITLCEGLAPSTILTSCQYYVSIQSVLREHRRPSVLCVFVCV